MGVILTGVTLFFMVGSVGWTAVTMITSIIDAIEHTDERLERIEHTQWQLVDKVQAMEIERVRKRRDTDRNPAP